jgi:phosphoglycolate phosphatase
MKPKIVVTDFDGVVGNSLPTTIHVAGQIVKLFDSNIQVQSFNDYRRLFSKQTELKNIAASETETLRELHRLLMRSNATDITLFTNVLNVYAQLKAKPIVVSSAYSGTVKNALDKYSENFEAIYGCDTNHKEQMLADLKKDFDFIYVTDTKTDIARCKEVAIPVIATTWGYDSLETLMKANPDFIANDFNELKQILKTLNLI